MCFWGWARDRNALAGPGSRLLLRGGGRHNVGLLSFYALWILRTFIATLRSADSKTAVFCVGTFSAIGPALASMVTRCRIVFLNIDNVSLSYPMPRLARLICDFIERVIARLSHLHVIPTEMRWCGQTKNLIVVRNTPAFALCERAAAIARERDYQHDGQLTLYVNGWLTETRGAGMILSAIRRRKANWRLLVAGRLLCAAAEALVHEVGVEYCGVLRLEEALALYHRANLVATFYDPKIPINVMADSNKWYDCLATSVPFVVNYEVLTARPFIESGVCFPLKYGDARGLAELLDHLSENRGCVLTAKAALRKYPWKPFEVQFDEVIEKLGSGVGGRG